jgi:hypothetical protein
MTEVTRIACPGCRSLLRFEPEALDFPADCGGCDCRFSVGIYVKIACPNCHSGSKIRERYLTQKVRCVKCSHPFIASEGIPNGGGGRLLVARMLESNQPNPPETIQPFLGHAREEYDRRMASNQATVSAPAPAPEPEPEPLAVRAPRPQPQAMLQEAERLKAQALAERDRLVHEAGLYKAILTKLVTNPAGDNQADLSDPSIHESLATLGVSMAPGLPGSARQQSEVALWRANEEKNRLETKFKKAQAELEAANAEVAKHRSLVAELETLVEQAKEERGLADQKIQTIKAELDQARIEAEESRKRLDAEVAPALQAAEESSTRLKAVELKLQEVTLAHEEAVRKEARLIFDHNQALEAADRQKTALSITVDRLTQAVISARSGEYEALDRLEEYASGLVEADAAMHAELNAERQRSLELDQVVKELQSDIETIRLETLANSKVRDAEANELRRRFAEERKVLMVELDKVRHESTDFGVKHEELLARTHEKLEASTALAEEWRTAAEEAQAQLQAEVARLEASLAKREQIRSTVADENRRLLDANEKLQAENRRLLAQIAEAGPAGLDPLQGSPNKKLAQAIEQNQMLHLDNVRLGNLVESAKIEADRRQKSLVLEIQRIKTEYEKLVGANEKLVDRVQELLAEKMAMAEAAHHGNGVRSVSPPPPSSAIDVDEAELLANRSKEVELHRDIAFSMLYGDTLVEKRPGKNGH